MYVIKEIEGEPSRSRKQWRALRNRKIQSCKNRKIPFDVPLDDYIRLMQASRCYFTGKKLNQDTRSIDRLDNTKGYVKGNVVSCDRRFNSRKGDLTPSEIVQMYKGLQTANMGKLPEVTKKVKRRKRTLFGFSVKISFGEDE